MRFTYTKIIGVILILTILAPLSFIHVHAEPLYSRECSLALAAVSSSGEGVISSLTVEIEEPGSGLIFISTSPAVEIDLQGSARAAVIAASIVAGFNPVNYNYYFIINSPSIIVGGPSAGAAMALAVLLTVEGVNCSKDFIVTGMINIDTTIGPVGGLKEKLQATASAGAKMFIIPMGQARYTYYERTVTSRGPFTFITWRPETVDLKECGEKLGVRVVEVADLATLYSIVSGTRLAYKSGELMDSESLRNVAVRVIDEASGLVEDLERDGKTSPFYKDAVNSLREARSILDGGGTSYEVLLKGIEGAILAQLALWSRDGLNLESIYSNTSRLLEEFNSEYAGTQSLDVGVIMFKGLAYVHAWTAGMLFNNTYQKIEGGALITSEDVKNIARALWEAKVAKFILEEAREEGVTVDPNSFKLISDYVVAAARSLTAYSTQLFSESGLGTPPQEAILMAISATILEDDPTASLFLSITSMSITSSSIRETFKSGDAFDEVARIAIDLALKTGSSLTQAMTKAALELRDHKLLAESMILSWAILQATKTVENKELSHQIQPQPVEAPISIQRVETPDKPQPGLVKELLESLIGSSIRALISGSIILAAIVVIAYIIHKRRD